MKNNYKLTFSDGFVFNGEITFDRDNEDKVKLSIEYIGCVIGDACNSLKRPHTSIVEMDWKMSKK
jgi:hypothetical protein